MEFVALTTRQLDYLARQDPYLEPIFKGVFASDQLQKEKETRSAYIVNVDTHDQQGRLTLVKHISGKGSM